MIAERIGGVLFVSPLNFKYCRGVIAGRKIVIFFIIS